MPNQEDTSTFALLNEAKNNVIPKKAVISALYTSSEKYRKRENEENGLNFFCTVYCSYTQLNMNA